MSALLRASYLLLRQKTAVRLGIRQMYKHSAWGVPSQGRNSKELTARENNGGTLGFNRTQRLKPYQYLYGFTKTLRNTLQKTKDSRKNNQTLRTGYTHRFYLRLKTL